MAEEEKLSKNDFTVIKKLGNGAYGRVVKVSKNTDGKIFAMKIVDKRHLKKENKTKQALAEKNLLGALAGCPGIVHLAYTFQDEDQLYYVQEFCGGGELLQKIQQFGQKFPLPLVLFYTAELVNALEFMHSRGICHRDLKPENVLLSEEGHLKLVDFGTAKDMGVPLDVEITDPEEYGTRKRNSTFVGTAEYVSPELLFSQESSFPVDLWALGCMVFQMLTGTTPFRAENEYLIFEKIRAAAVPYPEDMMPDARDFISKLLIANPDERLGADRNFAAIKSHPFLAGVDVDDIYNQPAPQEIAQVTATMNQEQEVIRRESVSTILLSGLVQKKAGLFYKKRQLIISTKPAIQYFEPSKNKLKGEIPISSSLHVNVKGKTFQIVTPNRTWYFKEILDVPDRWVAAVKKLVDDNFS